MKKSSISACIEATKPIARVVLMPGDPLRAKFVAKNYLQDVECFNTVRNMLGYTGTYKGKKISVMGSGMGIPSMGLYAKELYDQFGVDAIIRIGSAGGLGEDIKVRDVLVAMTASSNSNYGAAFGIPGTFAPAADYPMLKYAVDAAEKLKVNVRVGSVFSSDFFYYPQPGLNEKLRSLGQMAVEMETAGLYWTAMSCGKRALSILSISDHIFTGEALSAKDRQDSFHEMMEISLETAWNTGA